MKKGKRLLILLTAVVVFGAGAYVLNLNTQKQEAAKKAAEESAKTLLLAAPAEDTAKLAFTHGAETVALTKQDGAWVYEPRKDIALDTAKVDTMLGDLKAVESVRTVTDTADDAASYGLAEPALVITVTGNDGAAQTLSVGDKNASNGNYYASVSGKSGIYTISADVYNAFDVTLMSLLTEEAYPTLDTGAVTGLEWSAGGDTKTLEYHRDGDPGAYSSAFTWFERGTDGALAPVNADAVTALLDSASGITYAGTAADTKDDLAAYGLDQPALSLTLRYTEDVPVSQAEAAIAQEAAAATATPTATPAVTPAATPASTATPAATAKPTVTATATPTAAATVAATAAPAAPTATATPKATPNATATAIPKTTVAPTATPTAPKSGALNAALAEDAAAVPTETPAAEPTATPEPTVPLERSITLWFGNADADGNVYMTHSKTDRVFLVSADTLTALLKLTPEDLRASKPLQLSAGELTGLTATMNGVTKTVTSSTQVVTAQNGDQTTQVVYQVDGQEMKSTLFNLFVNYLKAIQTETYTDKPVATDAKPILSVAFTQNRPGFETVTAAYYPYDESFDQAVVNGDASMLVNKRDVANLQSYFDGMVGTAPTATPQPEATPAAS